MGTVPSWTQIHYRFGNNDGTGGSTAAEANYTFSAAEDTLVSIAPSVTFLVRIAVRNDGVGSSPSGTITLQCRKNAGAWQDVTTVSSVVKNVTTSAIANDTATTNRLTLYGGRAFVAGGVVCDDGSAAQVALVASGTQQFESVFVLSVVSGDVVNGDSIELRLLLSASILNTYTVTPTITVNTGAGARPKLFQMLGVS